MCVAVGFRSCNGSRLWDHFSFWQRGFRPVAVAVAVAGRGGAVATLSLLLPSILADEKPTYGVDYTFRDLDFVYFANPLKSGKSSQQAGLAGCWAR